MRKIALCFFLVALGAVVLNTSARAQLVDQFNPPEEDCCPRIDAVRLADHFQDVNQLGYYHAANESLKAQPPEPNRVVFLGDSITEGWKGAQFFPGKPYLNRGVSGQTTSQMLVRTFPDVIDLHPAVVIILAGTNDIAANNGPETMQMVEENIQAITELAQKHGIKVILCSVLPISDYTPQAQTPRHPPAQIVALNKWLRDYSDQPGAAYCDYFSVMVDQEGFLKQGYSEDGLHPNAKGYELMIPVAQASIEKALGR
jgi:lysophospholipase L1-like esterase